MLNQQFSTHLPEKMRSDIIKSVIRKYKSFSAKTRMKEVEKLS